MGVSAHSVGFFRDFRVQLEKPIFGALKWRDYNGDLVPPDGSLFGAPMSSFCFKKRHPSFLESADSRSRSLEWEPVFRSAKQANLVGVRRIFSRFF